MEKQPERRAPFSRVIPDPRSLEITRMQCLTQERIAIFHETIKFMTKFFVPPLAVDVDDLIRSNIKAAWRISGEILALQPLVYASQPAETPAGIDADLFLLKHENRGAFYTACYQFFGLDKSHVDPQIASMNLDDDVQRQAAWQEICRKNKLKEGQPG